MWGEPGQEGSEGRAVLWREADEDAEERIAQRRGRDGCEGLCSIGAPLQGDAEAHRPEKELLLLL